LRARQHEHVAFEWGRTDADSVDEHLCAVWIDLELEARDLNAHRFEQFGITLPGGL
jgi:hypothetical protein